MALGLPDYTVKQINDVSARLKYAGESGYDLKKRKAFRYVRWGFIIYLILHVSTVIYLAHKEAKHDLRKYLNPKLYGEYFWDELLLYAVFSIPVLLVAFLLLVGILKEILPTANKMREEKVTEARGNKTWATDEDLKNRLG